MVLYAEPIPLSTVLNTDSTMYLQWTIMGLSPEFLCHISTCSLMSRSPIAEVGTPSVGHPV